MEARVEESEEVVRVLRSVGSRLQRFPSSFGNGANQGVERGLPNEPPVEERLT